MPCLARAALVATVIGSGVMADRLANGNVALALRANTLATGAVLVALILTFGRISGAHFNPVVTFTDACEKGLPWRETPYHAGGQALSGMTGAVVVHLMFALPANLFIASRSKWAFPVFQ
jgi:glycerol uptake facilitator-like aquaporin